MAKWQRSEDSIEARWAEHAAGYAYLDLMILIGTAAVVHALGGPGLPLVVLGLFGALDLGVRLWLVKRREG